MPVGAEARLALEFSRGCEGCPTNSTLLAIGKLSHSSLARGKKQV